MKLSILHELRTYHANCVRELTKTACRLPKANAIAPGASAARIDRIQHEHFVHALDQEIAARTNPKPTNLKA